MQIEFVPVDTPVEGALAVLAHDGAVLSAGAERVDQGSGGALTRTRQGGRFTGAKGQVMDLGAPQGSAAARVIVAGSAPQGAVDAAAAEQAGALAFQTLKGAGPKTLTIDLGGFGAEVAAHAALGVRLASYRFDRYLTKTPPEKLPTLETVRLAVDDPAAAEAAYAPLKALAFGVEFTRDLVSEPANILYPAEFARRVQALEALGLAVEVLGEAQMAELGMGALLGVGQGSRRESQLAVIQWRGGADPDARPLALIGKGVCFDTGGISIKPAEGMEDMKWDMGGAGAVAGAMAALAGRKAPVNVVGVLGLVENMPDGNAQRPGDIVTSMSGQTVEVINTDAEGRLVLADAITYTLRRFDPVAMVDLATLTGAIIVALGHDYAGLFSNDDALTEKLLAASAAVSEPLWRMPLPAAYEKQLDSMAADMRNIGGRPAGSITAALFIQRFVEGRPWAHLDIASVAWRKPSTHPAIPEGATAFGVRLLDQLARAYEA